MKFIFDVTFPSWLGKSVNSKFRQHQSYRNNGKFKTAGKFLIAFVRLISRKNGVDGFTGRRQKSGTRYELDLKLVLKSLSANRASCIRF